ncbi:putative monovalent cation/H+ antiporter subunit F [Planctomycetes bacterium Poly30]|uniref:Putative monovalent cation/H+ antiporter subunit F n=1 Tax=Saltatorellus ferox TaxID=2528018 RepID=A0A518EXL1_9BACT|nr:putative monovalent cation/H+ antiporter subunit F [Planctomycetes bacterium Poly30]
MYEIAAFLLLASMGLALLRALKGPTVFDRILAVNMFGTATVLMISVIGFMGTSRDLVDIALIYALVSFTGTIAVLRFVEYDVEQNSADDNVASTAGTPKAAPGQGGAAS